MLLLLILILTFQHNLYLRQLQRKWLFKPLNLLARKEVAPSSQTIQLLGDFPLLLVEFIESGWSYPAHVNPNLFHFDNDIKVVDEHLAL